jgi:hypothetical protein
MVIVGVQPDAEFVTAFGVACVEPGVGPFVGQGAVKALDLAVGLGPVGSGTAMLYVTENIAEFV